jgi:hypothetical protein
MPKFASLLLLLLLTACSTQADRTLPGSAPVATEAECLQRGGQWRQLGRLQVKQCLLPTADAGKPCTDGGQCEGLCLAPEGTIDGSAVGGSCSVDTNRFGCRQILRDGSAITMCVD